ncbi:hypothetical protein M408DRAFT_24110 [Serendipita vermifera MAFF 305830]|uniref:BRCT domain-containing protein n=1 Tax=Serendipita vermifera MAFF 305830 TaxID=933852 RepID=A0A0C3AU84_SERVB|nr:hypothetical protein M408DRAFT_24110 [Serendipita vermifera MAFF 305830]
MDVERAQLFQLEDGEPLSIAVHVQIPRHDLIAKMIHENNGIIVKEADLAHFVILSLSIPNVDAIASELVSIGKITVQDYWVRDSVEARRLLPWYPYEVTPSASISSDVTLGGSLMSADQIEERDLHELVVTNARYGWLLSSEELFRHLSRKCPHRSVSSFKNMYANRQHHIESKVSYIRNKLDVSLSFGSYYHRSPVINFESPKTPSLAISTLRTESSNSVTTTGNVSGKTIAGERPAMGPNSTSHEGDSFDPHNTEAEPHLNPSVIDGNSDEIFAEVIQDSDDGEEERPEQTPLVSTTLSLVDTAAPVSKYTPSKPQDNITDQDKRALARFLVEHPQGERTWQKHMELFARKYTRGNVHSSLSWRNVHKMEVVQQHIQRMLREGKRKLPIGRRCAKQAQAKKQPSSKEVISTALPGRQIVKHVSIGKTSFQEICERDKVILARWMLENPKDPEISGNSYFAGFHQQHEIGSTRASTSWAKFASRHEMAIRAIQKDMMGGAKKQNGNPPADLTNEDKRQLAIWLVDNPVFNNTAEYFGAFQAQATTNVALLRSKWSNERQRGWRGDTAEDMDSDFLPVASESELDSD